MVMRMALAYRARAQGRIQDDVPAILGAARATMRRKRYCVLATTSAHGIHARVLQPFQPREDFSVLMGTSRWSRKVADLRASPVATLIYEDDSSAACVVLQGEARILEEGKKRFMPFWRAFWPEGPEDPSFVNLLFVPSAIEVWDARRGITPEPFGLVSARVVRAGDGWARAESSESPEERNR